jgi:hypothetical protein
LNNGDMSLDPAALEEVAFRVAQGLDNREAVFQWVLESCPQTRSDPGALREAVDAAFDQKRAEMASWPAPTDCDRLREAFAALERQGVVCLESPGLTQDDSIPAAAALAAARDEAGLPETHGYCFFTWNDLARVLDGSGLSLAFGSFKEEPAPPVAAPPAVCPHCKGRGWTAPSDPEKFPEVCACKKARPQAAVPAQSPGREVGAALLAACHAAGLAAEWSGSAADFVELPAFRWQRRLTEMDAAEERDFLESWELEVRAGYTPAEELREVLEERAAAWFEPFSDYGLQVLQRLQAQTERLLAAERAREEAWTEPTTNDRITAAFAQLASSGVLARECLGLTLQDGWAYAGVDAGPGTRGVVFFHHEDVLDAVAGRGLLLAFGSVGAAPSAEGAASAALAREVVAALQAKGVAATWSGAVEERIRIAPFEWRKRRWTPAPPLAAEAAPPAPRRPSFLSRLFGAKPERTPPLDPRANGLARKCALVVRALGDERGFDLRRSRRLREAWSALGLAGEAQAAHLGVPHAFVPARGHTSLVPRRSLENLRGEKDALFARGAAAAQAAAAAK